MVFFLTREDFFARQRDFFLFVWCFGCFLGVLLCFLVLFLFLFSQKNLCGFFRRWHEQNREFPLCTCQFGTAWAGLRSYSFIHLTTNEKKILVC